MGTIVVIVVVVLVFLLLGLTTEFVTGVWRRIQLYGGAGVGVVLLIGAILFMGLLIVSSGTDTPDSALEQREAEEGAAGEAQRDPQPEPEPEPEPVELEFSGIGPQATEQFDLSAGLARFELTHQGESNFSVYLLDETGEEDLIVSEIGPVEVSQALQVPEDGTYLVNVNSADGAWTIRVLQ
jgi:hypothetical protein